jgi:hypothetical protein
LIRRMPGISPGAGSVIVGSVDPMMSVNCI